jgi:phospholipid/cholesterol/gamma-HCH transport system permease protein
LSVWWRSVINQVRFTAVAAVPFIAAVSVLIGVVVMFEASAAIGLGAAGQLGQLLATVIVREAGPLFCAILVLARSGTAIAAEVATSRVLGETEALEALGVNPLHYIVLPRVVGAAVSVACLTLFFNALVLAAAGVTATTVLHKIALNDYVESLRLAIKPRDVIESLSKGAISGAAIAGSCAFAGLQAQRSPTEIPRRVTEAMVLSVLLIFAVTAVFAVVRYT